MSVTVLEVLQCAQMNFETSESMGLHGKPIYGIAKEQLKNAIEALENGKSPDFVLQDGIGADLNK